jgi:hypothetical protein
MLKVVNLVFLATEIPVMALHRAKHPADQSHLSNFSYGLRLCAYPLCILYWLWSVLNEKWESENPVSIVLVLVYYMRFGNQAG